MSHPLPSNSSRHGGSEPQVSISEPVSQQRQQLGLREYLNSRITPYLKKALSESLDAS